MASAIVMPRQGQSVESCFITAWHKAKGDKVDKGEILFSYETDKAAFEEESAESGILLEILYNEGDEVPVLETVAIIGQPGEDYGSLLTSKTKSATSGHDNSDKKQADTPVNGGYDGEVVKDNSDTSGSRAGRMRISPLAKKVAGELNIDISEIKGTGPKGRIIERDIRKAVESITDDSHYDVSGARHELKSSDPPEYRSGIRSSSASVLSQDGSYVDRKLSNMRRIIADKMEKSLKESAQLTHHMSADARKILALRKQIKSQKEKAGVVDIGINDMVCFAVINALKKHPFMNGHFMKESIREFNKVHLGVAVDTDRGLMVPVVRDADDMNLSGLAGRIASVAEACRKGSVDPELLSSENATFTVSNLGIYGVEMFTPVLNLPQIGILGVNTINYKPADLGEGVIGLIPAIGLSLTYDHRAVDGAPASRFLAEVKKEIEALSAI